MRKGAHDNGNGMGGALATDACHDDKGNGNVRGGPAPVLGKEMSYGMDMAAVAAGDDAKCSHE
jgi:hypothetical protein